ncbi:unnamed protein product [Adineta ricciae]|uniref:Innexin n=1 Tax=Adineta ricciae TaxID=249248 RepID=A0A813W8L9_ADIRI|nr:unnamed protein product [Adineta ricciae]
MDSKLNYYQWTPFIILLMALFFYLPRLIWRTLSIRAGIDLLDIVQTADDTKKLEKFDERDQLVSYVVDTIDMYVDDARRQSDAEARQASLLVKLFQLVCCMTGKFLGNYFITLYMFIKLWYILNVILQICLLNLFLDTNFLQFGYESIKLFRYGLNQPESKYFPRETFCDFQVREPLRGGEPLQRITVQCVLTVNLFNQQTFTLLWIWYVFVFLFNIYSFVIWIGRLITYRQREKYIQTRLARISRPDIPRFRMEFKYCTHALGEHVHAALVQSFITEYLEPDGFFILRMLALNVSDFFVQEIIEQLWERYTLRYGNNDAIMAEEDYYSHRQDDRRRVHQSRSHPHYPYVTGARSDVTDGERKYMKQNTEVDKELLRSKSSPVPRSTSVVIHEPN